MVIRRKEAEAGAAARAFQGRPVTFIALASSAKAIIAYHTGKRDSDITDRFIRDLRERVLGMPEISTDGYLPYLPAIRDAFGNRVAHGVVTNSTCVGIIAPTTPAPPPRRSGRRAARGGCRRKRRR
jgi:hypothetical protein